MSNQPPGANPSEWVPRTDAGARKLIDRIDRWAEKFDERLDVVERDVERHKAQQEGNVTHRALLVWAASAAVVIGGAVYTVMRAGVAEAKEAADTTAVRVAQQADSLKLEIERTNARLDELQKDVRALYRASRTRQREPRLERPPEPP